MRKLTLLIFVAVLFPLRLMAEPIVVRSGEHNTFTRLVMQLPTDVEWSIAQAEKNPILKLENYDGGFDLSVAFEIIPRTRLQALVAKASQLELQLACNCVVDAFLEQNSFLVIDITNSDRPVLEDVVDAGSETEAISIPASGFSYGELLWSQSDQQIAQSSESVVQDGSSEAGIVTDEQSLSMESELVSETQERLLAAFSSAASRGILTPKPDVSISNPPRNAETPPAEIFDSSEQIPIIATPLAGNMRISNSSDIPESGLERDTVASSPVCMDPAVVDVASWGHEEDMGKQIGTSVLGLYDPSGRLMPEKVLAHARLQLYFGLGQEAKQTLEMAPSLKAQYPELLDIASVLEFGHAQNPRSLHRFADCDSDLALWALLAASEIPPDQTVNALAALRGLDKLPSHLKSFLAQKVSERLAARGDVANASIALRSYQRLTDGDDEPRLVHAELADLRNEAAQAEAVINDIVNSETSETAEAIIELIDRQVAAQTPVEADVALLAETYALELRNSEKGPVMLRAFVLAAASSGQYTKAFETLDTQNSALDVQTRTELTSFAFTELADGATDIDFLEAYFDLFSGKKDDLNQKAIVATAQRLFDLGFHTEAASVLLNRPIEPLSPDARLLKSRLALLENDYQQSYDLISDLNGTDAALIKGQAMQGLGKPEIAAQYFSVAEAETDARDSAWLSDDWNNLLTEDDMVFGQLRAIVNEPTDRIPQNNEMINNSNQAIASSANARLTLEGLLTELEVQN
ncbi:hypothetical protein CEP88_11690 [Roseobacter denitrificans]|uniref:Uncharacterized protein n=1 Tax=Roseobacter denitrificans (strain ATCC 33942 / OCh 114) TaxID=375451 RepID=Q16DE4_ROSDO|nr:hypothetical protein [Roseobacter denitrificans]ABG29999.1 hypothetical protein RD1_0274 [Roseobacter denitrificans OCh 114]AVL53205.1 hypothetical protein CEP88_11690 [Roseobacter denitrificans]SFF68601.1 hypothetical protein SAMN05443635_1019 [Roseobacter denitrificans OCh 114]